MNKFRLRALSPSSGLLHRGKRRRGNGRNYVRPGLELSNFSKDEDELILKLHALLGNRWSLIAGRLPGRTENEVMIHWETYLKRKLMKMGIDPTNHRLYHHTHYVTRRYLDSSHQGNQTKYIITDQSSSSSSVSESRDITILPISNTGQNPLPDLNISLIPRIDMTSLRARCLEDSGDSSNYCSTDQETLPLFR